MAAEVDSFETNEMEGLGALGGCGEVNEINIEHTQICLFFLMVELVVR